MDLRCQYASTHCPNTRSLKISGDYHRFCLFHRRSANAAQRRWKQKKLAEAASSSNSGSDDDKAAAKKTTRRRCRTDDQATATATPTKRCRPSREIAMPRVFQAIQQGPAPVTPVMPIFEPIVPLDLQVESLLSLLTSDYADAPLGELIVGVDEVHPTDASAALYDDCWWIDAAFEQATGVVV